MVFSSPIFLFVFLPVTYLGYRILPGLPLRNAWLTLASLVFFSFGQLPYLVLLLISVLINYLFGLWLQSGERHRRLAAGLAAAANLSLLGVFKYVDFLISTFNSLSGAELALTGIVLPIGISFYTFQGMSYVIDVYRHPEWGTRNPGKLLLYISFFPQLIAGPIVIYHDVADQIDRRELTPELTLSGLRRFILGLGKKMLLANSTGEIADAVFAMTADQLDFRLAWLGAVCYTLQIYFDFSGYSDMAIGLGRMFGFAYGEKENGAVFSHMAVMYANALYRRGFAHEGWKALKALADTALDFDTSRIYPGIPEYFRADGRGMYHYLTGAASWYMMTMITQAFGVRGQAGDLLLAPALLAGQFDSDGAAELALTFAGKPLCVRYENPARLDAGQYRVAAASLDGAALPVDGRASVLIPRVTIEALNAGAPHRITVTLRAAQ